MPGQDGESRKRGRIERRDGALRVRVYAGDDPVTGKRVYRSETVPGTDRAAQRRAEKALRRLLAAVDAQPEISSLRSQHGTSDLHPTSRVMGEVLLLSSPNST